MDTKLITELVKLLNESSVEEIEITRPFFGKIRISKRAANSNNNSSPIITHHQISELNTPQVATAHQPIEATPKPEPKEEISRLIPIKSPMVGTFYRAPAPDADPYVREGDRVEKGQVVCIVEAMKLMNEIESEVNGIVKKILVENAKPVEFNQDLFLIEPF
jgi:acetyl-CoA carboxylase biotin carboxyl carrier protein